MEKNQNQKLEQLLVPLIEKLIENKVKKQNELVAKMVKEEVQNVLIKGGVLSQVITECFKAAANLSSPNVEKKKFNKRTIQEAKELMGKFAPDEILQEEIEEMNEENERIVEIHKPKSNHKSEMAQRLQEVAGIKTSFEDVEPLESVGEEGDGTISKSSNIFDMRNIDPSDPGVNLNGIYEMIGGKSAWKERNKKMGQKLLEKRNNVVSAYGGKD